MGASCCATVLLMGVSGPSSAAPAAAPAARVAELDPTVIFSFPGAPIYVEPGQPWTLPVTINEDVGGRPAYLQKRVRGHWATVKRTRARGHRLAFSAKEKKSGTYAYRIVVPTHGGFEARTTKVQTVHVEPISDANRQYFVPTRIAGTFTGTTRAWDNEVMSWSGTVTFELAPPYQQGGLSSHAYYRPTAASVSWRVDYRDWRDCHFEGSGTLGLDDIEYEKINGAPQESVAPLGRPDEYDFALSHQWDKPVLAGTVTCQGALPPGRSSPPRWDTCSRRTAGRTSTPTSGCSTSTATPRQAGFDSSVVPIPPIRAHRPA